VRKNEILPANIKYNVSRMQCSSTSPRRILVFSVIVISILQGVLAFSNQEAVAQEIDLSEDFESGALNNWTIISASVSFVSGSLSGSGRKLLELGAQAESEALLIRRDPELLSAERYSFEVFGKLVEGNDAWSYINVYFLLQSSSSTADGYVLHLRAKQNSISIMRLSGGVQTSVATVPHTVDFGKIYRIRVEVYDGDIKAFIDGALLISIADNEFTSGTVGISTRTGGGSWTWVKTLFDDLHVESLPPQPDVLELSVVAHPSVITCSDTSTLLVHIEMEGLPEDDASVKGDTGSLGTLSDSEGVGNGNYLLTYTPPDLWFPTIVFVNVSAYLAGVGNGHSQVEIRVFPIGSPTLIVGVLSDKTVEVTSGESFEIEIRLTDGQSRVEGAEIVAKSDAGGSSYPWNELGDGRYTGLFHSPLLIEGGLIEVEIIAIKIGFNPGHTSILAFVGPLPSLEVTDESLHSRLRAGETISIDLTVTSSGSPVSGAEIDLELHGPISVSYESLVTDSVGKASLLVQCDSTQIPERTQVTIHIIATKDGYTSAELDIPISLDPLPERRGFLGLLVALGFSLAMTLLTICVTWRARGRRRKGLKGLVIAVSTTIALTALTIWLVPTEMNNTMAILGEAATILATYEIWLIRAYGEFLKPQKGLGS